MKHKKLRLLALLLALLSVLPGCARGREEKPAEVHSSYDEAEIAYPRIQFFYRDFERPEDVIYISLTDDMAHACREAREKPAQKGAEGDEWVGLFYLELERDQRVSVFESLSGERFFSVGANSCVCAEDEAKMLFAQIEKATGENCEVELYDFRGVVSIELLSKGSVVWRSSSPEVVERLRALIDGCRGGSAGNFDRYDYELRGTLDDGRQLSLFLSSEESAIYIKPFRYYRLERGLSGEAWLEVFGLESWPG